MSPALLQPGGPLLSNLLGGEAVSNQPYSLFHTGGPCTASHEARGYCHSTSSSEKSPATVPREPLFPKA